MTHKPSPEFTKRELQLYRLGKIGACGEILKEVGDALLDGESELTGEIFSSGAISTGEVQIAQYRRSIYRWVSLIYPHAIRSRVRDTEGEFSNFIRLQMLPLFVLLFEIHR